MKESPAAPNRLAKMAAVVCALTPLLLLIVVAGLSVGSTGVDFQALLRWVSGEESREMISDILWRIRLPRVLLALLVGATLSLGGLVFQAILKNPLAEPYILGVSGGAAIGAIVGILLGFSRFPGVSVLAFAGSMTTLLLLLLMASGKTALRRESLLLSGVMVNAFCSAVIMFLVSITQDARLHNILFWLMGDLSQVGLDHTLVLGAFLLPCFAVLFYLSNAMNLLLLGRDAARTLGLNAEAVTVILLVVTSFMVSSTVSFSGLLGFVGLVMPHMMRLLLGPDHRLLVPACLLGGGGYMILCDLLARTLPRQGEMPAGVVTALIGAPLFIALLKRSRP